MTEFSDGVISAVLAHMNDDHTDDNLRIVQAFGAPDATAATMSGLDGDASFWRVTEPAGERDLRIAWPSGPITERPEIRREVVLLHDQACAALGIQIEPH
ncbi:DUF2470 domain-containing protein [Nocardioides alcanivorans]|uniref:DUF2470 domain-containing protein n=1 Tax=Nocardioides alcanivorans TaxID=2897352 RepID=UPI001F159B97|nr:DUF2470 domain-containing protein [Nocardioides alcanivorans]